MAPGITVARLTQLVLQLQPDLEGAGDDGMLAQELAQVDWLCLLLHCSHKLHHVHAALQALLPGANAAWETALAAALTSGAEARRQSKSALSKVGHAARFCAVHFVAWLHDRNHVIIKEHCIVMSCHVE